MADTAVITVSDVRHVAKLANLPLTADRIAKLTSQLETTFEYIQTLNNTDTKNIAETNQVNGLHNVWREDFVDTSRMLTQDQALANAPQTHDGYFLVPAVLE